MVERGAVAAAGALIIAKLTDLRHNGDEGNWQRGGMVLCQWGWGGERVAGGLRRYGLPVNIFQDKID